MVKINTVSKMILFIFLLFISIVIVGCGTKDISTQRKECKQQGHDFSVKKALNFRTGKYELRGICKV